MGVLKLRATGLKKDLEEISTYLEETSEHLGAFEVISESKDYPNRDSKELRRYFEIRFDSELMDKAD